MKKKTLCLAAASMALVAGGSLLGVNARSQQNQAAADAAASAGAAPQASAQVKTAPVQMKQVQASITAYGDVLPGSMHNISSAAAAQIARLKVIQGQSVAKGELLAVLEPDPAVRLGYEQAQTSLKAASAELERVQSLASLQLATQSQVDAAARARADALAALRAQQALGGAQGGQTVTAPASGVILSLTSFQGDRVQAGVPFMQLGSTDQLKVVLGIDPADQAQIRKGQQVRLTALSDNARSVNSTVSEVQGLIDPKTQLINVVVRLPAAAGFNPGSRVRAEIMMAPQSAWEVPRQAVLTDAGGSYVYQVSGRHAHRVAVRTVADNRTTLGVTGPLDASDPLVVLGNYELSEGMPVRGARQ
ncbi:efflux RND transporter periplasmic adaptor subunit [Herbaspirillum lusitanum]|uniref:Efflux RND transporter periplasmic adaptor subunit n=1 Tax=Herbaspirillum lusitanum TaxID=213312 RepID=A0ABW9A574_9BURK